MIDADAQPSTARRSSAPRVLIALAFVAYISLGLPDGVLGVAWPSMREAFRRPVNHIGFLLVGSTIGYVLASALGGTAVRVLGIGKLLIISSALVTIALAGYGTSPIWAGMVVLAVCGGLGAGAIDAGLNAFAAARFSPRVVNWLHACWGIGATLGPLLMTAVLASRLNWRVGYLILATTLLLLTILFLSTLKRWSDDTQDSAVRAPRASMVAALRQPIVWVQIVLFFFYTGLESTAGQLLFTLFTESRGVSVFVAGLTVGFYWGALTVGRLVFGQLSEWLGDRRVLRIGTIAALPAAALIAWNPVSACGLSGAVLLGFALSPIFPTLISRTPSRVGAPYAAHAVGFQVSAASVGIAVCPGLTAWLARQFGLEAIGVCLVAGAVAVLILQEVAMIASRRSVTPGPAETAIVSETDPAMLL